MTTIAPYNSESIFSIKALKLPSLIKIYENPFTFKIFYCCFTGVGMILVTVSGAAWRMTAPGAPQCLGLGSGGDLGRCGRRPCSGRAPHGLLYPEFQHRPPPPSYQASMQEYRLR